MDAISWCRRSCLTTPPVTGTPAAPTGLTATAGQAANTVDVSWTAPTDNGLEFYDYRLHDYPKRCGSYDLYSDCTVRSRPLQLAEGDIFSSPIAATNTELQTGAASAAATITVSEQILQSQW